MKKATNFFTVLAIAGGLLLALTACSPASATSPGNAGSQSANVDWAPTDDPATQEWVKKIEARAKMPANFIQSVYYDGANILAQVLERSGTDPKAIQDGLRSVKGYKGITGEYSFDEKGDGLRQAYIGQIKDGKVSIIKTVKGQ